MTWAVTLAVLWLYFGCSKAKRFHQRDYAQVRVSDPSQMTGIESVSNFCDNHAFRIRRAERYLWQRKEGSRRESKAISRGIIKVAIGAAAVLARTSKICSFDVGVPRCFSYSKRGSRES